MCIRDSPTGVPASFAEHAGLMYDLQLLAHQTDRTRVTTFMSGHELSGRTYPEIDVPDAHHPLSHHRNVPEALAKLTTINTYHVSLIPYFLNKLKNTPDGDGTLLDRMMIIYGSPMGNSNVHNHKRCPLFLAGHANGQIKGNLHIITEDRTPMANVMLTLLHKLGLDDLQSFGDSTSPLAI